MYVHIDDETVASIIANEVTPEQIETVLQRVREWHADQASPLMERFRSQVADDLADSEGECEVDDGAIVSYQGHGRGAYVMSWVWAELDPADADEMKLPLMVSLRKDTRPWFECNFDADAWARQAGVDDLVKLANGEDIDDLLLEIARFIHSQEFNPELAEAFENLKDQKAALDTDGVLDVDIIFGWIKSYRWDAYSKLHEKPAVIGGICRFCGRDYTGDITEGSCPEGDCPSNV